MVSEESESKLNFWMPVHGLLGSIWQYRGILWEMQYIEAIINMTFPLEKENLRALFLSNSETHPCVGEPVIPVTGLDKDQIGGRF